MNAVAHGLQGRRAALEYFPLPRSQPSKPLARIRRTAFLPRFNRFLAGVMARKQQRFAAEEPVALDVAAVAGAGAADGVLLHGPF